MDEIVLQAMSKWPNVPHCFGWLRLDARGYWRMRDERAQQLDLPGDKISHPALLTFINRNYQSDNIGQWYFQNGPQRVYVDLELTPYIAHTDPALGLRLHTGVAMPSPSQAWLTPQGQLILRAADIIAALDDRDNATLLTHLCIAGTTASDEQILAWLEGDETIHLQLDYATVALPLQRITAKQLTQELGFTAQPRGPAT
jgi:hypothetical protein